jgi:hypothetical protein
MNLILYPSFGESFLSHNIMILFLSYFVVFLSSTTTGLTEGPHLLLQHDILSSAAHPSRWRKSALGKSLVAKDTILCP